MWVFQICNYKAVYRDWGGSSRKIESHNLCYDLSQFYSRVLLCLSSVFLCLINYLIVKIKALRRVKLALEFRAHSERDLEYFAKGVIVISIHFLRQSFAKNYLTCVALKIKTVQFKQFYTLYLSPCMFLILAARYC